MDNLNDSKDDGAVDVESDQEQDIAIDDLECPVQRDVSASPNVTRLIRPTWKSKSQDETVLVTVNEIETRRYQRVKKM